MKVSIGRDAPRFSLPHYHGLLSGHELSYHQVISKFSVPSGEKLIKVLNQEETYRGDLVEKAFEVHSLAVKEFRKKNLWRHPESFVVKRKDEETTVKSERDKKEEVAGSLLDLKIAIAKKILRKCILCERRCGADRTFKKGACGIGLKARIASEFVHLGEEKEIVPSYTVFFAGCNFRCVYCQNWDIAMYPDAGEIIDHRALAKRIDSSFKAGVRNVNFVGGNPDPDLYDILKTISLLKTNVPVVWNSNMYASIETMKLLDGVADLYLADFRYGDDECARKYSNVPKYFGVVSRNFVEADRQASVIIRHLVLPGHLHCCTEPIMEWVSKNMPDAYFNLMFQYRPEFRAGEFPEIARRLTYTEINEAKSLAEKYQIQIMG